MHSYKYSDNFFIIFIFLFTIAFSNTRVAFSRPGALIRTPSLLEATLEQEYHLGFSSEIINFKKYNSSDAIFFKSISTNGFQYGIAYSSHAEINQNNQSPPSELSFHFSKRIYEMQKMNIEIGVNDILYSADQKHELSVYIALLNSDIFIGPNQRFKLQTSLGFGTGKINYDSHNYTDDFSHRARFFFGLNFKTPYLLNRGGLNLMLDFDGSGTHIGTTIPINKKININLAMTNLQNFDKINKYQNSADKTIYSDAFGLSVGLAFKLQGKAKTPPRVLSQKMKFTSSPDDCIVAYSAKTYNAPLSLNENCQDFALNEFIANINNNFATLNDSIKIIGQINNNHILSNTAKNYEIKMLQDSINMQYFKERISKSELNIAMKHVSKSLQYYYNENYLLALEEINKAIVRFPDMAIAYARKGSIYYQMGDLQQATINWNLALKYDPEYIEVREMLSGIKIEIDKISSNNYNN